MTKNTALHQSAQSDKRNLPHRGGHTYTKSKNSLRRRNNRHHHNPSNDPLLQSKNLKFVSKTVPSTVVEEAIYKKLDPNIPEQAKRLQSRRRMISYGKNTVGYDEYLRQVPKEKRRPRCMETPSTPDYTLDMPNKRWTGQVRAWRRALHKYDPPDLQTSFQAAANEQQTMETTQDDQTPKSIQELQLEQAKAAGLPVQFGSTTSIQNKNTSPTSVLEGPKDSAFDELDQWEDKRNDNNLDDFVSDGGDISDDSDDDLL